MRKSELYPGTSDLNSFSYKMFTWKEIIINSLKISVKIIGHNI